MDSDRIHDPVHDPLHDQEPTLRDYLVILYRRRWIVAVCLLIALGTAVGFSLGTAPVYRATTTVTVDKTPPVTLFDRLGGSFSLLADRLAAQAPDVATLAELIRSHTVREGAVARLQGRVGRETAEHVVETAAVQQVRNTEIVRISVEHTDPRVARDAANAIAASLVEISLRARRERATEARTFIDRQLVQIEERLRRSEDALLAFKDRHGNVRLAEETTLALQTLSELEAQKVNLQLQRREVAARLAGARARLAQQARVAPVQWTPSPLIATLQAQLAALEIELTGLERQFTAKHPAVQTTRAKIAETRRRLDVELAKSLEAQTYGVDPLYQDLVQQVAQAEMARSGIEARAQALDAALAAYTRRIQAVPAREAQLARLTREAKVAEEIYLLLAEKAQEARIAEASIGPAVRVLDSARLPERPVRPRPYLNTLFGILLGLMVGVVAAFVLEQLDDTVRTPEEVERAVGAPVLSGIPVIPNGGRNGDDRRRRGVTLLQAQDHRSAAAEAFRALRTHVLYSMPDVERKVLLVTSALPGEGKSLVAGNLALWLARMDRRVGLVEADLRKPSLGTLFPEAASPGLAAVLSGQARLGEVIRETAEPHLWFVASGPIVPNAAELLGARRMAAFVEEVRQHADVVILDSPPVLPVTDAEVAAAYADGVLLVVRLGVADRRALRHARERLRRTGARIVGVVLNGLPSDRRSSYYGAYYYQYSGEGEVSASPSAKRVTTGRPR